MNCRIFGKNWLISGGDYRSLGKNCIIPTENSPTPGKSGESFGRNCPTLARNTPVFGKKRGISGKKFITFLCLLFPLKKTQVNENAN